MKIFCISIKSKITLAAFFFLLVLLFLALEFVNINVKNGDKILTNEDRVNLISTFGYDVLSDAVDTKQITIPETFSDVYKEYNKLQQQAGFNLENYSGYSVDIYKYKVIGTTEEQFVNIIICDGVLIGGDVSSALLDGEMLPLRR